MAHQIADPKLKELVDQWLRWDKNQKTRAEIEKLVRCADEKELKKRLGTRIAFGTAGLRGTMQAGFACMNDLTVIQASQGLCRYVEKAFPDVRKRSVCIGFDGRHNSKRFSELAAATFLSQGIPVYMFSELAATPVVPYAVLQLGSVAGVMVTASHNPKDDNGYKVYWDNGCQIASPHDKNIAELIEANLEPWKIDADSILADSKTSGLLRDPTEDITARYMRDIRQKYCFHFSENQAADRTRHAIVYTPMHGVGYYWAARAFAAFGLPEFVVVSEQKDPNGDFPTVEFPNPEEGRGALRLSMATADRAGASLIIANDPDADRLAVAEKHGGEWRIFSGNEIGILLADWVWRHRSQFQGNGDRYVMISTAVSSKMLAAMAAKEGFRFEETLTGFKWIGLAAEAARKRNPPETFLFAFEEAIGFMVGDICLDKDGIRGAVVFAEMWLALQRNGGKSCAMRLEELYAAYGFFANRNRYFFCYDPEVMVRIFDTEMRRGGEYLRAIGPYKVTAVRDLTIGYDSRTENKKPVLPISRSTQMITFWLDNGAVATLRGSGTEPKLKYYVELNGPYHEKERVRAALQDVVDWIIRELLKPDKYGLVPPND